MKRIVLGGLILAMGLQNLGAVGSGGFSNQVVSARALGMGNTFVALANHPSAIFFNPAGLTQQKSPIVSVGVSPEIISSQFTSDAGVTDRLMQKAAFVPNFYAAYPFMEGKLTAGLGFYSPFGLSTQWSDTGPLRYIATESNLTVLQINPVVAYQVIDGLSAAAGVVYTRSDASLKRMINVSAINGVASADGGAELSGKASGVGYNVGVLYQFLEQHRLGATYRSRVMQRIKGDTRLTNLTGATAAIFGGNSYRIDSETDLNLPESLMLGYAFRPGKWTFEMDAEWVDYSSFGEIATTYTGAESNLVRQAILNAGNPDKKAWHAAWNFGAGVNYEFNETWQARGGYYYYPEVSPETLWTPAVPEAERNSFSLGGTWTHKNFSVDLAYSWMHFNDRTVHNTVGAANGSGGIAGTFKTDVHLFLLDFTYKFGH